ncbi:hypothetical protein LF1_47460 [Rubripirellula obstinata]|uniref:Pilus assembly protein, PilO n=1 Tax=Rubripirellula obstinata TaxID=406547 RepID=A0A5B1CSJ4_9BACT|nr:hypothetical protein [Rubripirellula obstinata]KAA1262184.1 hypothetical protein LF1_47460 [Rubripirellula obstinata]
MATQKDWKSELNQIAEVLRDPFKMRMVVAGVTLAVMSFVINDPLQGKMQATKQDLSQLKNTVRAAEEVMLLRDHMEQVQDRIFVGKGNDAVLSHLIELIRSEDVDLMRIDAGAPTKLGPLHSVRISIEVLGSYQSLLKLLHDLDSDHYLIRIEDVAIKPPKQTRSTATMNVDLRIIKETL